MMDLEQPDLRERKSDDQACFRQSKLRRLALLSALFIALLLLGISVASTGGTLPTGGNCTQPEGMAPRKPGTYVYLGNGCFWERQWAYVQVEQTLWRRPATEVSAKVGYAGGSSGSGDVCYHCGISCSRDYSRLGHAEVVEVRLDSGSAQAQMEALAGDFFGSMQCGDGGCIRPDPMDRGGEYRSLIGVPGGVDGPLYAAVVRANTVGMTLKSGLGDEGEERNTVLVYNSEAFPFHLGEPYHQFHSNFFMSDGMPYPSSYTHDMWCLKASQGEIPSTGCPDGRHQ